MDKIKNIVEFENKFFEPFILHDEIQKSVVRIAGEINREFTGKNPIFVVTLNGGFIFGADLIRNIDLHCEVSFTKLSSYQGMKSTENVKEFLGINEDLKGRNIIIVEDIIDTGNTMEFLLERLKQKEVACVKIATLLFKKDAFTKNYHIDYIGFTIPDVFVLGYGLDFNGYGRNLKDIYSLVQQ